MPIAIIAKTVPIIMPIISNDFLVRKYKQKSQCQAMLILHPSFFIKKIIPNFFEKNCRLLSVVC